MSYITQKGTVDSNNTTTSALNNGQTFTGIATDVSKYPSVVVALKTDQDGLLYVDFSPDSTNWDSTLTFTVAASTNEVHKITVTRKYFRLRVYNDSGFDQTYLRAQTLLGEQGSLNSFLNSTIQTDADSVISRSVLTGLTDGGDFVNVPATPEGHLEVAIHDPLLPFGALHTEKLTPLIQRDAIYGLDVSSDVVTTTGSGSVSGTNNLFKCSTGTTPYSYGAYQSRKRLRYRPGQGVVSRYTAVFSEPVAGSIVVAGVGTGESGFYFALSGTQFGILHSRGGVREIQTLNISTASTSTSSYSLTANGIAYSVPATNNGSTLATAYEISKGTYAGWSAEQRGSTVVFLANDVGNKTGVFGISQPGAGSPVIGSFTENLSGVASTDRFYPKTEWNVDVCDGTGRSGFNLNPQLGNIYSIYVTYLGFGPIEFKIRMTSEDSNNATDITVHTINYPNTSTATNVSQPAFPFTMAAYSAGSTTDVWVATASYAGFIEGDLALNGPRMTYEDVSEIVKADAYYSLLTVRNDLVFKNRANQTVIRLLGIGGAHDDATPVTLYAIKNATLLGTPNFTQHSTSSCTYVDTAATTCTITDNSQIIYSIPVGQGGSGYLTFEDNVTIQPGETLTLAAKTTVGTSTYTIMSLNTREDQ